MINPVSSVKRVIAIASGKGGVGKSTTAIHLAYALKSLGWQVGLLDADIYGPNQPHMLGVPNEKPKLTEQNKLIPITQNGIQTMSIGYLIEEDAPVIWRGPMISTALHQLIYDTEWQDLDCLILDLPPGTGDVQLSLAQKVPLQGAVIVTTPQEVALLDVKKAIKMFQKVKVPILGVIENMSHFVCPHCQHEEAIFGSGGGDKLAAMNQLEKLGSVPILTKIQQNVDAGKSIDDTTALYLPIAKRLQEILIQQKKDYRTLFPKIVIEKDQ